MRHRVIQFCDSVEYKQARLAKPVEIVVIWLVQIVKSLFTFEIEYLLTRTVTRVYSSKIPLVWIIAIFSRFLTRCLKPKSQQLRLVTIYKDAPCASVEYIL